jgi:signal transduction histidine kinase
MFLFLLISTGLHAADTLVIEKPFLSTEIYNHIALLEDPQGNLDISTILNDREKYKFYENNAQKLNFKYSESTYWLRIAIKNISEETLRLVLDIPNPDLDNINFFEVDHDSVLRTVQTGELSDVKLRDVYNRNFLFNVTLDPGVSREYYFSVKNNGHSFSIPLFLMDRTYFNRSDSMSDIFNWAVYGLLIFIVIFNFYLFWSLKDRVKLYYSLSLVFAILTFLHYDGYFYMINPPRIIENIKWINPGLYSVFLLLFTQSFVSNTNKYNRINKLIRPLKFIVLIVPFAYNLKYPFSLLADIGFPILVLIVFIFIIIMAVASLRRDYLPSQLFIFAYVAVFLGLLIHQLKEFNVIQPNFFVISSIKIGLTIQNLLLTFAVLERFRINQLTDKQTISENLVKIERQNKELEIINTELEKLSIVASETDNSIAIYDKNGRLEWGNTGFEKLYEVHINDLMKGERDKIENIIPNEDIGRYVSKCLESRLPVVFETAIAGKHKKVLWVQTTLSPFLRSGKVSKIISIDSDITSLKDYERELEIAKEKAEASDRLKTAFLHNISHEIRTPMNSIIGFSGLLSEPDLDLAKRHQFTDIIVQSSNHLLAIINDIIRIASIEAGQEIVMESHFDLNLAMEYLHEQYTLKAREKNITIAFKAGHPQGGFHIFSDEVKLTQILTNLIDNALKFTHEGYINYGYVVNNDQLTFFVEDSGIGIAPEMHEEIFKRFRQVENSNARKFGGSGLGLSISKAYVELLGGKIWLDSGLQKGSRFYFTVPLKISGQDESEN